MSGITLNLVNDLKFMLISNAIIDNISNQNIEILESTLRQPIKHNEAERILGEKTRL